MSKKLFLQACDQSIKNRSEKAKQKLNVKK